MTVVGIGQCLTLELSGGGAVRLERIVSAHRWSPQLPEKLNDSFGLRVIADLRVPNADCEILVLTHPFNKHLTAIKRGAIPFLTAKRRQRADSFINCRWSWGRATCNAPYCDRPIRVTGRRTARFRGGLGDDEPVDLPDHVVARPDTQRVFVRGAQRQQMRRMRISLNRCLRPLTRRIVLASSSCERYKHEEVERFHYGR